MTIVIFNNNDIYKKNNINLNNANTPSPTNLLHHTKYNKLINTFHNINYNVTTTNKLHHTLTTDIQSHKPTIINIIIDPTTKTKNNHITKLNPKQIANN